MSRLVLPVPLFQQRRPGECLAACAAMVLAFIGVSVAYNRLLTILEIIPDTGTPSFKIRLLERLGVTVSYLQGTLADLRKHLQAGHPCIVFVRTSELPYRNDDTEHAVVVVGMDDQFVYISDPEFALSPVRVSLGDFDLAWLEHDEKYAVITR